jgi:hypothetical protein
MCVRGGVQPLLDAPFVGVSVFGKSAPPCILHPMGLERETSKLLGHSSISNQH